METTTITVDKILWEELSYRKVKNRDPTLNQTIGRLIEENEGLKIENKALLNEVARWREDQQPLRVIIILESIRNIEEKD